MARRRCLRVAERGAEVTSLPALVVAMAARLVAVTCHALTIGGSVLLRRAWRLEVGWPWRASGRSTNKMDVRMRTASARPVGAANGRAINVSLVTNERTISLQPRLATTTAACLPPHPKKERKRERERKRGEGEGKEPRPHPSPRARCAWSRRVVWLSRSSTCTRNADRATGRRASTVSRRRVRASPPP